MVFKVPSCKDYTDRCEEKGSFDVLSFKYGLTDLTGLPYIQPMTDNRAKMRGKQHS